MRNPDKSRFLSAARHIETEEIPLFESDADTLIVNRMLSKNYELALRDYERSAADQVDWNRQMGNDMILFDHIWRLGRKEEKDEAGRIHYIDGTMKTPESLNDIWYPDSDLIRRRLDDLLNAIEGTGFGIVCTVPSAGFIVVTAIGYEDFCVQTIVAPEFVLEFQKRIHEYTLKALEMYLEYPIDVIQLGSGLHTGRGTMLSPEHMETFEYTYFRQQAKVVKDSRKLLLFHIDGNVVSVIPTLLEMGMDILHPIETGIEGQDIYEIKQMYGDRLTLCGNIDINGVLLHGTPEEVKEDVQEHISRLAVGGGYIVASSHDMHQLIPVENVYAMRDAVHDYHFGVTAK